MNKIELILAHLTHYEKEFNESPHLQINKAIKHCRKYLTGFDWK